MTTDLITDRWTTFQPHAGQHAAWTSRCRFVGLPCGRGSGKTELAKRRLVRFLPIIKPWSNPRYFYAAPTRDQAKLIAWDDFKAMVPVEWLAGRPEETSLCIKTVFGSELRVVGMDKPQRIEGPQWDGGVIDEACDQKPGSFDKSVLPALTHRNGWCWRIGVPKRQGPSAQEFRQWCEKGQAGTDPDIFSIHWPSSDILSPEQLAYARANLDAKDYAEQFDARWETAGGGVFHAFDRQRNVRPCSYVPSLPILVGSDFNVDPMAWVLAHRHGNRVEVFDELWLRDTNTPAALDVLAGRYADHRGGWEFYGDATGQARRSSANESDYRQIHNDARFVRAGRTVHYPKANPARVDRFASTNAMFTNAAGERRLFVDPRCVRLIDDLQARSYKVGTRDPDDSQLVGHASDALGYIVHYLFPIRFETFTPPARVLA